MAILTLNVGSSSLKATLFDRNLTRLLDAEIKGIHQKEPELTVAGTSARCHALGNIQKAFVLLMEAMQLEQSSSILAVGHRFIHGGWKYKKSVHLDAKTIQDLQGLKNL